MHRAGNIRGEIPTCLEHPMGMQPWSPELLEVHSGTGLAAGLISGWRRHTETTQGARHGILLNFIFI